MAPKFRRYFWRSEKRKGEDTRSVAARMLSKFIESCDTEFMRNHGHIRRHREDTVADSGLRSIDQNASARSPPKPPKGRATLAACRRGVAGHCATACPRGVEQYLSTNGQIRSERSVHARQEPVPVLPNVPVRSVTRQQAGRLLSGCYQAARQAWSIGCGCHAPRSAALGQGVLGPAAQRELATDDPWSSVEPIGRGTAGKPSPGEAEARKLDQYLFRQAEDGDEGALALLLALYLGLRTSEVLGLTVGAIDGTTVFVAGTKTKNARRKLALYEPVAVARPPLRGTPGDTAGLRREPSTAAQAGLGLQAAAQSLSATEIPGLSPQPSRPTLVARAGGRSDHAPLRRRSGHASFDHRPPLCQAGPIEKGKRLLGRADVLHGRALTRLLSNLGQTTRGRALESYSACFGRS